MKRITIEVPLELYAKIKLLAYTEDTSLGAICRRALINLCDQRQAHKIKLLDNRDLN